MCWAYNEKELKFHPWARNDKLQLLLSGGSPNGREPPCEDDRLFFSEYAEGSSNNKYLEIFNGGSCTANLSEYAFPNANNGADIDGKPDFWNTFPAGAVLKPGAVYIIAHPSAAKNITVKANHTHLYLSNGDDGYCLVKGNASAYQIIDCIGNFNKTDPGEGWAVCGIATATMCARRW